MVKADKCSYPIYSVIGQFFSRTKPKNLDYSFKMDLYFNWLF